MPRPGDDTLRRVAALSLPQRRWLATEIELRSGRRDSARTRRLLGYFTGVGDAAPSQEELRAYLALRLPEYMLPSALMQLDELPRTAGGKLDRAALPASEATRMEVHESIAPRNETEVTLACIWQEVLGVEEVSIDDDFMEVGGDSLLSIRVLSRARREGIELSPEVFFEAPTIRALALHAKGGSARAESRIAPISEAPLTPIQHWFFENIPDHPEHWNQSLLLLAPADFSLELLQQIAQVLCDRHDALQLSVSESAAGRRLLFGRQGAARLVLSVKIHDQGAAKIAETAAEVQAGFDLAAGPLIRFVLYDAGLGHEKRLLIVAHHLIIDAVSWGLLLSDLDDLYRRHREGAALELPPPTASFGLFAKRLAERAAEFSADARYWVDQPEAHELPVPVDHVGPHDSNLAGSACIESVHIDPELSDQLLREIPAHLELRAHDVLLTALLQAWTEWSGSTRMLLDLEGHGRDLLADELDVGATVGWFTTVFPVVLTLDESETERLLQSVGRQLRDIVPRGGGHGVLRYLSAASHSDGSGRLRPSLLFNHLGRSASLLNRDSPFGISMEAHGPDRHPKARRAYLIEINSRVENDALCIEIEYHPSIHERTSIELLADRLSRALHAIADASRSREASDSDLSGLDSAGLEKLAGLLSQND